MNLRTAFQLSFAALALGSAACPAPAHDPFDVSARMNVRPDGVELTATFGMDAARRLLASAGYLDDEIARIIRPRGPQGTVELSATVAAHFFAIDCNGEFLDARNLTVLSDGLEVIFTSHYPRPNPGTLNVRAVCYERVPQLRQGSLIACDEKSNQLGAALLSRGLVLARINVPDQRTTTEAPGVSRPETRRAAATAMNAGNSLKPGAGRGAGAFEHRLSLIALPVGIVVIAINSYRLRLQERTRRFK